MSNWFIQLTGSPIIEALGWTLFHSLWLGLLAAILLAMLRLMLKKYHAAIRYYLSLFILFGFVLASAFLFGRAYSYAGEKKQLRNEVISNPGYLNSLLHAESATGRKTSFRTSSQWIEFRAKVQRHFPFMTLVWITGVIFFLTRLGGGMVFMIRIKKGQTALHEEKWIQTFYRLKNRTGLTRHIQLLVSNRISVPVVIGYLKPVILIPVSLVSGMDVRDIEAILAHELAHIKRNDFVINILQIIIETLFFYHPGVWFISRCIRDEREHSCDETALSLTGDKLGFIRALANTIEVAKTGAPTFALAFSGESRSILKRVQRIKNHETMKSNVQGGFIAASILFFSLVLLSFTIDGRQLKTGQDMKSGRIEESSAVKSSETEAKQDSIEVVLITTIDSLAHKHDELEKLVEVAVTEHDEELSLLILESMELARQSIDMQAIMHEVDSAMKQIDIQLIVHDAMAEAQAGIQQESLAMAEESARIAMEVLEDIDLEVIIGLAFDNAMSALQDLDIDAVVEEAIQQSQIEVEEALREVEAEQRELEANQRRIEAESRALEAEGRSMEARQREKEAQQRSRQAEQKELENRKAEQLKDQLEALEE